MTISPIPTYPRTFARPAPRGIARTIAFRSAARETDPGEWSLELDIRLRGEPDPAIVSLLSELRRLVASAPHDLPSDPVPPVAAATVVIDVPARTVTVHGRRVELTRLEFDLLRHIADHPARVLTREELLGALWSGRDSGTRTIDVHVRRLRAKTGVPLVTTVRGIGYRLADAVRADVVR
jgi:hypothetical protein